MDIATLAPFAQLSAVGALVLILIFAFRAVSSGEYVSKREMDYLRADRDARIAELREESADWRAAHETSERARELLSQQNRELIAGFRTFEHFFESLRLLAEKKERYEAEKGHD